ncbi:hypothetical protein [Pseudanabaena sp. PCC 6802]|uniref:hypothetical protein n=1 Tax=Pseudanabaena sp. PCC 6802 TaxID=118173 RepID=UPI00034ADC38|nr:hypothetical protein [Pseudanabaena sp. PCC 6802]
MFSYNNDKDGEISFIKDFLMGELGLTIGVDFSFTPDELLLSKKAFLSILSASDEETKKYIMSVTEMS